MIPIVVATYPENGSKDTVLNSPIKITFADSVDIASITASHIKLENLNDGSDIPLVFDYTPGEVELIITPPYNEYGNLLFGLTKYRLSIANISSLQAEYMQGLHTLEFMTVSDSIERVIQEEQIPDEFALVNFYPKQGSYGATPNVVKIKCNKDILAGSVNSDTFTVTSDTIEDINDIGFISINKIAGDYNTSEAGNGIISFTPTEALKDNMKYTVILSGIQHQYTNLESEVIIENLEQTMYSFHTALSPLYVSLNDIQTTYSSIASIIKGMNPIDVLEIIKENSEMAYWVAQQNSNESNIVWNPPNKIVIEYVKAKTRYDIVFDKYVQLASDATSKTLGDLSIEYNVSIADLLSLADKLKMSYLYWENMLKGNTGGMVKTAIFAKGENVDEDPEYKNRSLKDWSGTKSW